MNVINLTPHPIMVYARDANADTDEPICTIMPTLPSARCLVEREYAADIPLVINQFDEAVYAVSIFWTKFGDVTGLPEPRVDTMLIVSKGVYDAAAALPRRADDLLIPDDTVRYAVADPARGRVVGQIAGCRAFAQP